MARMYLTERCSRGTEPGRQFDGEGRGGERWVTGEREQHVSNGEVLDAQSARKKLKIDNPAKKSKQEKPHQPGMMKKKRPGHLMFWGLGGSSSLSVGKGAKRMVHIREKREKGM